MRKSNTLDRPKAANREGTLPARLRFAHGRDRRPRAPVPRLYQVRVCRATRWLMMSAKETAHNDQAHLERVVKVLEDEAELLHVINRRITLISEALTFLLNAWCDEFYPEAPAPKGSSAKKPTPIVPRWAALRRDPERVVIPFHGPDGAA